MTMRADDVTGTLELALTASGYDTAALMTMKAGLVIRSWAFKSR